MKINVYTLCYNEEVLIPYFFRHYGSIADRIVVYDNGSTDKSRDLVQLLGGELRDLDTGGEHSDRAQTKLKSTCYYESRGKADWVIVVDMDEFLYHPDFSGLLKSYMASGITMPKVLGFDMFSSAVPSGPGQIYEEIFHGWRYWMYNKFEVFHPSIDINFSPGCHKAYPQGPVKMSDDAEIKLLHYRYLGAEYFKKRYVMRMNRISEDNVKNGWGIIEPKGGLSMGDWLVKVYHDDLKIHEKIVQKVVP